jgi:hypothetical protein
MVRTRVRPTSAAPDAPYPAWSKLPDRHEADVVFMIRPQPWTRVATNGAWLAAVPLVAAAPEFRQYAESEEELDAARDHVAAAVMAVSAADAVLAAA